VNSPSSCNVVSSIETQRVLSRLALGIFILLYLNIFQSRHRANLKVGKWRII
jgi:hypothetical protein